VIAGSYADCMMGKDRRVDTEAAMTPPPSIWSPR
jgi:hypothetical protein